jgi:hypothetical protein
MAAAEDRLQVTDRLEERVADVRGWAENPEQTVRTTVDVHGALTALTLQESALTLPPDELGREIVRLAAQAQRAALRESVSEMGDALGDSGVLTALHDLGLEDTIDPDAPVLPYVPGVDPNAHTWRVIPPER